MKLTDAQITTLEQKARNCRDNARSERIVADTFNDEYMRGISGHPEASAETHARSMELYDFVIRGRHRAKNYEDDASLFEACAQAGREALKEDGR